MPHLRISVLFSSIPLSIRTEGGSLVGLPRKVLRKDLQNSVRISAVWETGRVYGTFAEGSTESFAKWFAEPPAEPLDSAGPPMEGSGWVYQEILCKVLRLSVGLCSCQECPSYVSSDQIMTSSSTCHTGSRLGSCSWPLGLACCWRLWHHFLELQILVLASLHGIRNGVIH